MSHRNCKLIQVAAVFAVDVPARSVKIVNFEGHSVSSEEVLFQTSFFDV